MFWLQLAMILLLLWFGAKRGGMFLGMCGGIGLGQGMARRQRGRRCDDTRLKQSAAGQAATSALRLFAARRLDAWLRVRKQSRHG